MRYIKLTLYLLTYLPHPLISTTMAKVILQAECPSCHPTNSIKALNECWQKTEFNEDSSWLAPTVQNKHRNYKEEKVLTNTQTYHFYG